MSSPDIPAPSTPALAAFTQLNEIPIVSLAIFFLRAAIAAIPAILLLKFGYVVVIVAFTVGGRAISNAMSLLSR
ncbi:MAG: hypothetical protein JO270_21110 [Acidobacteriaceae bacterium]|nr:hypothetical protein [Acidobacteriaceae bacterium]